MNSIQNIIYTLKKSDILVIEMYLKKISKSDKKLKLFKLIVNNKLIDEKAASILIYGKYTYTIRKLKERLLQDIEDVIILRYNKNSSSNLYNKNEINTISFLIHAQYYLKHGLLSEADKKLKKAKKLIDEHNFVFLASFYYQLSCEYLDQVSSPYLRDELIASINNFSELKYIQKLKLTNSQFDSGQENSTLISNLKPDKEIGFYSTCLDRLTQLKFLIFTN